LLRREKSSLLLVFLILQGPRKADSNLRKYQENSSMRVPSL
jgi:hypothetical protein